MALQINVRKEDEVAALREMVERVEGEIQALGRSADPADREEVDSDLMARIKAINERVKAADRIGTPGDRAYRAGGGSRHGDNAARYLGMAITAARRASRKEALGPEYEVFGRVQSEGTDTAGGVTVATDTVPDVIRFIGERSLARLLARYMPMTTDQVIVPIDNGAQTAYWPAEGVAPTDSSAAFKAASASKLDANTAAVINKVSRELREDSLIAMESYLGEYAGETLAAEENKQMLKGSGAPFNGISGGSGVNTVTLSTTAFSSITFPKLADAEFGVDQSVLGTLSWVGHKDAFLEAYKLRDSQGFPLWATQWNALPDMPTPVPQQNKPALLMGNPFYLSKQMDQSGTGKTFAIVGSFRDGFIFGDRRILTIEWDDSIYFPQRQRAILVSERIAMLLAKGEAFSEIKCA